MILLRWIDNKEVVVRYGDPLHDLTTNQRVRFVEEEKDGMVKIMTNECKPIEVLRHKTQLKAY